MKAVRLNAWGQPLQIENIPQQTPGPDEVLVHIRAASVNPFDRIVIAGYLQSMLSVPMTPGTDFAGDVVAVGENVKHVNPGDAVYGMISMRGGAFAEYAVVKANEVARKPKSLDYVQAAATPLAALTARQTLLDHGKLKSGEKVLIHGAGGSVGNFAVQLAKAMGGMVIANDKPDRAEFIKQLGADQIINSQDQAFEDTVRGVDIVLNYANSELEKRSYGVLKSGGRYVTIVGEPSSMDDAKANNIEVIYSGTQPTSEALTQIAEWVDAGKLKQHVSQTFSLDQVQQAMDHKSQDGHPNKVVITTE